MSTPSRLVCFSTVTPQRPELAAVIRWQLDTAFRSLRRVDPEIDARLYCCGEPPPELEASAARHRVELLPLGDYGAWVEGFGHPAHPALSRLPLLHKWLCLAEIGESPSQVLAVDSDVFFAASPRELFESCATADLYAREEPGSRASPVTDPGYLDEGALYAHAAAESLAPVAPFNTGVMLLNRGAWLKIARCSALFLSFVWRFLAWMAEHPSERDVAAAEYLRGEGRELLDLAADEPPLAFPSTNRWLVEEHAAWLTVGSIGGFRTGLLPGHLALQDGEYLHPGAPTRWTLCHYFGVGMDRFASWLDRGRFFES